MNTIYSYLFSEYKLWRKYDPSKVLNSSEIIDKQTLKTKTKSNNAFITKTFAISKNCLYYLKNDEIKGYLMLDNIGVEYSMNEKKLSLFNNHKYFTIYFDELSTIKKWKKILKEKCIFNNFQNFYNIIGKLGEGGNAQVYLAKKNKNKKEYAIKIITKSEIENSETGLDSLINEIKIIRSMNHKNVTKYYELYESNNNFYLVMEYCNSKTLKEFIKTKSTNKEKVSIINQIIDGLSHIHSKNLVHRDLKPDNIFLQREKNGELTVKIGDFGLSNFLNENFIFKKCGTPGFISPEILNYNKFNEYKITNKVDVYSIGHIIHYIFTNLNIYNSDSLNELILKNQKNKFKLCKDLNNNLKKIIESCLLNNSFKRIELSYLKELINSKLI